MSPAQQTTGPQHIVRGNTSSLDGGEDNPQEHSRSVTAKFKAPKKVASKQKGKQPKKNRNTAKLSKLPDMPLDILYDVSYRINSFVDDGIDNDATRRLQIFSFVHPVDLLRISWASKPLRNVLTSKSSRQVWITAFDNIPEVRRPLPCPQELTEIGYANLIYESHCMVCVFLCVFFKALSRESRIVARRLPKRIGWLW